MTVIECRDVAATQALAASVARLLRPGDVILLNGDLGAGKTTFTQGLARALGVDEVVTSPTFTLVRNYSTSAGFQLCHVDAYRLDDIAEVVDLALPEVIDDGAVVVVEWGQKAAAALAPDVLEISIVAGEDEGERHVTVKAVGPGWVSRVKEL